MQILWDTTKKIKARTDWISSRNSLKYIVFWLPEHRTSNFHLRFYSLEMIERDVCSNRVRKSIKKKARIHNKSSKIANKYFHHVNKLFSEQIRNRNCGFRNLWLFGYFFGCYEKIKLTNLKLKMGSSELRKKTVNSNVAFQLYMMFEKYIKLVLHYFNYQYNKFSYMHIYIKMR